MKKNYNSKDTTQSIDIPNITTKKQHQQRTFLKKQQQKNKPANLYDHTDTHNNKTLVLYAAAEEDTKCIHHAAKFLIPNPMLINFNDF